MDPGLTAGTGLTPNSGEPDPPAHWPHRAWIALACLAVAAGALGVVLFHTATSVDPLVMLTSFTPFLILCGLVGTAMLAGARSWRLAAVGLVVLAAGLFTQAPMFIGNAQTFDGAEEGRPLRVLQANVMLGEADMPALVRQVRDREIDLLTVDELTDDAVAGLSAAGLNEILPHSFLAPVSDLSARGTGIYSRYPLTDTEVLDGFVLANLYAVTEVEPGRKLAVMAVHPLPPGPGRSGDWAAEMGMLHDAIRARAADGAPMIVSGDFNATHSHAQYRALLTDGFADAAERSGAGLLATYPTDKSIPAVVDIDHVIVRQSSASDVRRVELPGADHEGIFAVVTPWWRVD